MIGDPGFLGKAPLGIGIFIPEGCGGCCNVVIPGRGCVPGAP